MSVMLTIICDLRESQFMVSIFLLNHRFNAKADKGDYSYITSLKREISMAENKNTKKFCWEFYRTATIVLYH